MYSLETIVGGIGSTENLALVLATVWVINNKFAHHATPSLTMAQYAISNRSRLYHQDLIEAILLRAASHRGTRIKFLVENINTERGVPASKPGYKLNDEEISRSADLNRDKAIWFLDSLDAFKYLEADLTDPENGYHRNGLFCLIYTGNEADRLENIKIIFHRLFGIYVINVNAFTDNVPNVYTYFPFAPNRCQCWQPQHHFVFANMSADFTYPVGTVFFPQKLGNLHGCELILTTFHYNPYTRLEKNERTGEVIRIIESPTKEFGLIFENGTGTGSSGLIMRAEANFTLGGYMRTKQRTTVMLPAYTYMNNPLVLIIPMGHPMSPFERLTKPLRNETWSCLFLSVFVGLFVIFVIKFMKRMHVVIFVLGHDNRIPVTNLFNTLFGGPVHANLPLKNFARYLLALWLLYSIIIRTAYTGELYKMLQDGHIRTTLQTLEEVFIGKFTFIAAPLLQEILRNIKSTVIVKSPDANENSIPKILDRLLSGNYKEVLPISEHILRYYHANVKDIERRLPTLPEKLLTVQTTMYMTKHSYLENRVNHMLLRIMSAGFFGKFEETYLHSELWRFKHKNQPIPLHLNQILAVFSVCGVLHVMATAVFLLELWSGRSAAVRNTLEFLNC